MRNTSVNQFVRNRLIKKRSQNYIFYFNITDIINERFAVISVTVCEVAYLFIQGHMDLILNICH